MTKKLLLLSLFCSLFSSLFSQEVTEAFEEKKWTVSSRAFSQPYVYQDNNLPNLFTGVSLKRYFGPVALRISYDRYTNYGTLNFPGDSVAVSSEENFLTENAFRIGTEYRQRYYDVVSFHLFLDYMINPFEGHYDLFNPQEERIMTGKIDGISQGAIFGVGIDWFLSENFSLGLETRMDLVWNSNNLSVQNFEENYTVNFSEVTSNLTLNLLGNFSLNYHF